MRVGIRADGNSNIGIGHLQRCFSIAEELMKCGHDCLFFVSDKNSQNVVKSAEFECINLQTKWNCLEIEIFHIVKYIKEYEISCILMDTYFVTNKYLKGLHKYCKIAYIDDLFECIYPYDLLINYSLYYGKYPYEEMFHNTKLLLGSKYIPLREQFKNTGKKKIQEIVERILITTGGTDPYNFTSNLVFSLAADQRFRGHQFDVICGAYSEQTVDLMRLADEHNNINVFSNVKNMAMHMKDADIAITASGTTLYELCATGTPFICFTLADNQKDNAYTFHEKKLTHYAGDVRYGMELLISNIKGQLAALSNDYEKRKETSVRLQKIVDGYGAKRIAEELIMLGKFN